MPILIETRFSNNSRSPNDEWHCAHWSPQQIVTILSLEYPSLYFIDFLNMINRPLNAFFMQSCMQS